MILPNAKSAHCVDCGLLGGSAFLLPLGSDCRMSERLERTTSCAVLCMPPSPSPHTFATSSAFLCALQFSWLSRSALPLGSVSRHLGITPSPSQCRITFLLRFCALCTSSVFGVPFVRLVTTRDAAATERQEQAPN